ncbi:MAG: tripartite tricarboxylate transporter TctB family protein [Desulfovibrio sp.]|nr:tripartite tricarboxylate transporter TctB family protein [Desulfovibrio sp.]
MKKSDIGVIAIMYVICVFFFAMTVKLPEDAQTYPLCLISGLCVLNTLYLAQCLWKCRRAGFFDDLPQIFNGFLSGQFFMVAFCCLGYLVLMYVAGFYIASLVYLTGVMALLSVPKSHILLTVSLLAVLIYFVFTLFLKVPLPTGILFK